MKTIEEAAREYSLAEYDNGTQLSNEFDYGFKKGVEFAQRWIPVDSDEKPEEEFGFYKPVLVLDEKYGLCSSAAYKNGEFIPDNPVINPDDITHWRPIELR
jgi:hypothetical protein